MLLPILILTHCFSPECNSVSGSALHDNILLTFFIFDPSYRELLYLFLAVLFQQLDVLVW